MVAIRTCVGCRQQAERDAVVRFTSRAGVLAFDERGILPGRGAWLHPDQRCFDMAVKRKAFPRALRQPVSTTDITFPEVMKPSTLRESGLERDEHPMRTHE